VSSLQKCKIAPLSGIFTNFSSQLSAENTQICASQSIAEFLIALESKVDFTKSRPRLKPRKNFFATLLNKYFYLKDWMKIINALTYPAQGSKIMNHNVA